MRHRIRNIVWRELPFSARRGVIRVLRTIDGVEAYLLRLYASLFYSPAWLFVAAAGSVGIVLTILLFFAISQEILAGTSQTASRPVVIEDDLQVAVVDRSLLDSRLCIEDRVPSKVPYPAEFGFDSRYLLADERVTRPNVPVEEFSLPAERPALRPPSRRVTPAADDLPRDYEFPMPRVEPASNAAPVVSLDSPELELDVRLWRQPRGPAYANGPAQVMTAHSVLANVRPTPRQPWGDVDPWTWYRERPQVDRDVPEYAGDSTLVIETHDEALWEDVSAWPNRADVGLKIALYAPTTVGTRIPGRSRVTVENSGADVIRRVELQEPIRPLDRVTAAEPAAALMEGTLYRELRRLRAGQQRTFDLAWTPRTTGDRHHEARVLAEAFVAASVHVTRPVERIAVEPVPERPPVIEFPREPIQALPVEPEPDPIPAFEPPPRRPVPAPVEPRPPIDFGPPPAAQTDPAPQPKLICQVTSRPRVARQGIVELEIQIANSGDVALSNVRIWADLPENLKHPHGGRLELVVGRLGVGQVQRSVLRVIGEAVGISRTRVIAVSSEVESDEKLAVVAIVEPAPRGAVPASATQSRPGCRCDCLKPAEWQTVGF